MWHFHHQGNGLQVVPATKAFGYGRKLEMRTKMSGRRLQCFKNIPQMSNPFAGAKTMGMERSWLVPAMMIQYGYGRTWMTENGVVLRSWRDMKEQCGISNGNQKSARSCFNQ